MKDNVIDFEARYYLNKLSEAKSKLLNQDFKGAIEVLDDPCKKIDKLLDTELYCPQNIFESAVCLNLLGKDVYQRNFSRINFYEFYKLMASSYNNLGDKKKAKDFYNKAIKLDPVSLFARISEMELSLELKEYDDFLTKIQDAMYFAYSRQDMAKVYDLAGDYLVYKEDYEMALVSYNLSNIYVLKDEMASKIEDVAKNAEIDLDSKSFLAEDYMRKFYNTYKIALMPNPNIVKLSLTIAKDAYDKMDCCASKLCYEVAYDLTYDESLKPIIEELANKCKKK